MDTIYFERALAAWEKKTGQRGTMASIDMATFSQLMQDAQELKRLDREKKSCQ